MSRILLFILYCFVQLHILVRDKERICLIVPESFCLDAHVMLEMNSKHQGMNAPNITQA